MDALLSRAPLPSALKTAISGESLFNDGAGVVLFQIMLRFAQGEHGLIGHGQVAAALATEGIGGGVFGCATGFVAARVMRSVDEPGLRLMVSMALVTGTYRLADLIGISGPTAVVACGLVLRMRYPRDAEGGLIIEEITRFWHVIDELLNAMLFVLIGFELLAIDFAQVFLLPIIGALPLSLFSRMVGVVLPVLALRGDGRQQRRGMAVLTWAGLRGGVSIALALTRAAEPVSRPGAVRVLRGRGVFDAGAGPDHATGDPAAVWPPGEQRLKRRSGSLQAACRYLPASHPRHALPAPTAPPCRHRHSPPPTVRLQPAAATALAAEPILLQLLIVAAVHAVASPRAPDCVACVVFRGVFADGVFVVLRDGGCTGFQEPLLYFDQPLSVCW